MIIYLRYDFLSGDEEDAEFDKDFEMLQETIGDFVKKYRHYYNRTPKDEFEQLKKDYSYAFYMMVKVKTKIESLCRIPKATDISLYELADMLKRINIETS